MRFAIFPYREGGVWMFDDESVGLYREPFVRGAQDLIEDLVADLEAPEEGFRLNFSSLPFDGWTMELAREQPEGGGAWYVDTASGVEGWLCSAICRFFPKPPEWLYASAEQFTAIESLSLNRHFSRSNFTVPREIRANRCKSTQG